MLLMLCKSYFEDAQNLVDKQKVILLQTQILDRLRKYHGHKFPGNVKRYGKMLLRLPFLRTVSAKAAERFLSLTLDGTLQLNELVLEMINWSIYIVSNFYLCWLCFHCVSSGPWISSTLSCYGDCHTFCMRCDFMFSLSEPKTALDYFWCG